MAMALAKVVFEATMPLMFGGTPEHIKENIC
jgi:hypothetical protein